MGNSTIIELNHDRWDEIYRDEESQKEFLEQIRQQLQYGEIANKKELRGGRVVLFCHREDKRYDKFLDFKKSIDKQFSGYSTETPKGDV